jgi:hypothetical protein
VFFIHKESKIGSLLNDTYTDQYNPLFELVTSVQEGRRGGITRVRARSGRSHY